MKLFSGLIVAVYAVYTYGATIGGRVVGGTDAPEGAYPYQVSLRKTDSHLCGGCIINERYILTAAQCVSGAYYKCLSPSSVTVAAGTNKRNESGIPYNVDTISAHKGYDPLSVRNDIALIRTSEAIVFNERVQPISLPNKDSQGGDKVVLTGWGLTSFPGYIPNNLQQLDLVVVDTDFCVAEHGSVIRETNVCTFTKSGEGICHGDHGGPLADPVSNSVIGIVSWGRPCANGKPDVFTRVYSYLDWIADNQVSF